MGFSGLIQLMDQPKNIPLDKLPPAKLKAVLPSLRVIFVQSFRLVARLCSLINISSGFFLLFWIT